MALYPGLVNLARARVVVVAVEQNDFSLVWRGLEDLEEVLLSACGLSEDDGFLGGFEFLRLGKAAAKRGQEGLSFGIAHDGVRQRLKFG